MVMVHTTTKFYVFVNETKAEKPERGGGGEGGDGIKWMVMLLHDMGDWEDNKLT